MRNGTRRKTGRFVTFPSRKFSHTCTIVGPIPPRGLSKTPGGWTRDRGETAERLTFCFRDGELQAPETPTLKAARIRPEKPDSAHSKPVG